MTPATINTVVLRNNCLVLIHVLYVSPYYALGNGQFGFRRVKRTRDAIGILRITPERFLDLDEVCLRDRMAEGI
jgi:hypothetical protein